jgi:hypothetical protein
MDYVLPKKKTKKQPSPLRQLSFELKPEDYEKAHEETKKTEDRK